MVDFVQKRMVPDTHWQPGGNLRNSYLKGGAAMRGMTPLVFIRNYY